MSGEHHWHGSDYTYRGPVYLDSLEGVSGADLGIGPVWCGGMLYWCDGEDITSIISGLAPIVAAPAAAGSDGVAGQIAYDATHIYVCVATDTWVRASLATWS